LKVLLIMKLRVALVALMMMFAAACAKQPAAITSNAPATQAATMKLASSAFTEGQAIPRQYTCSGINISPPLEWSGIPKSAKTIAIIADDPDAPAGTWVHWVIYNLPADTMGMIENLPPTEEIKGGGLQGKNDFEKIGYGGPCPPSGTHRYFFKIYALDNELPLQAGAMKADVEKAMSGHVLAQAQLMGTFRK
jgi:Raf kinase inhibitor-like YbhB/YbcL family protein